MVSLPNHRTMNGQLNLINIPVLNTVRSFDWLRTNGAAPERVNGPAARTTGSNLILMGQLCQNFTILTQAPSPSILSCDFDCSVILIDRDISPFTAFHA